MWTGEMNGDRRMTDHVHVRLDFRRESPTQASANQLYPKIAVSGSGPFLDTAIPTFTS